MQTMMSEHRIGLSKTVSHDAIQITPSYNPVHSNMEKSFL